MVRIKVDDEEALVNTNILNLIKLSKNVIFMTRWSTILLHKFFGFKIIMDVS